MVWELKIIVQSHPRLQVRMKGLVGDTRLRADWLYPFFILLFEIS
jgi:hypothetical protein